MSRFGFGIATSLSLAALVTVVSPNAKAGCGEDFLQKSAYSSMGTQSDGFSLVSASTPSIVGMWKVKFVSKGKQIDFGYSVWSSDGTEFLNSGSHAPVTQNYCLGVWKQIKAGSYFLNHLALSYDTTGKLNARVRIREDLKLAADGNSYKGIFTIDAFDPTTGKTLLQHTAGSITGTRVTLATTTEVD